MENNIILETLEEKLNKLIKKRDNLLFKLNRNPYSDIIAIRKEFQELINQFGVGSDEVNRFSQLNVTKEKELRKEAEYLNNNYIKNIDDIYLLDRQLSILSNEIAVIKMRKKI
jgi:hypothetical protein